MFQELLTNSLVRKDSSYLSRIPPVLLEPTQKAALDWIRDYQQQFGELPTPGRMSRNPDHGRWCQKAFITKEPLSELYHETIIKLKQYRRHVLTDDIKRGDPEHRVECARELLRVESASAATPTLSLREMDRDRLYAPKKGKGITFGLTTIDAVTKGLLAGENAYFAGRPGDGKTMILCFIAVHQARLGRRVFFNSKEMPNESIVSRIDGILGSFDTSVVRSIHAADNEDERAEITKSLEAPRKRVAAALAKLEGDIIFPTKPALTPAMLFATAETVGADVIIADGVYLMTTEQAVTQGGTRDWRTQASVTSEIKERSLEAGIPLIGSTQLKRGEGQPDLETIAFSDSIGQDADVVILMQKLAAGTISLTLGKNRNGADRIGQVIKFDFRNGAIIEGGSLDD